MTDAQKTSVKNYVAILNSNIPAGDLLDMVVDIVNDRVLLYINDTVVADNLLRVIAQVVVSVYKRTEAESSNTGADKDISSVSDNGQTVTYTQKPTQYLASSNDQELFTGFEFLLNAYRRPHVITTTV